MELRDFIDEIIHENLTIEIENENVIIITPTNRINYKTDSLDRDLVLKVLLFISQITLENKFKIESVEEEEIFLLNEKYSMEFLILINDAGDYQNKYNNISNAIDVLDTIQRDHPNVSIRGVYQLDEVFFSNDEWVSNICFNYEYLDEFILDITAFFYYTYEKNQCLYTKDYMEYIIDFPELDPLLGYIDLPEIYGSQVYDDKVYFEITKLSLPLFNLLMKEQEYGSEVEYEHYGVLSLKVYNLNSVSNILYNDSNFKEYALKITKDFIFHLSMKYNINLNIVEKNMNEIDTEDLVSTLYEKLEMIQENDLVYKQEYDKDLIQYYYQASLMEDSPFKYLAYYQVIECIYDEVLMATTVGDIQQLINSSWFNSYDKTDIQKIIEKIKWHNNSKKDEDKLKLVMEKYFRNNASDDVFLEVNKEIIELCKKMKIIKDDIEFKDLQKLQKKIYRYRCDCTHSNRTYPISKIVDNNSIQDYIKLIKLISERIILNYH